MRPSPDYDHVVRYLRMFTNAAAGGALGATYLTVLVLQLNPRMPEISVSALHWLLVLVSSYGLHLTIGFYLLMLIREAASSRPLQPAGRGIPRASSRPSSRTSLGSHPLSRSSTG